MAPYFGRGSDLRGLQAAFYLRKSRVEEGIETQELLSRHQKALCEYAQKAEITVLETYHEVVSGESLYARPEMLRLLEAVEQNSYDAVLVMDLDRLSRGRMKDQGIILDTFRDSDTLIVTPEKTYDLHDEIDDELAEFKTFMSRREYKIINKRLQRGLRQSIHDGYYVANPPYGYQRHFIDKRPSLSLCHDEADFVRMMFSMYLQGFGCTSIARHVNLLGARPHRSDRFSRSSVAAILRNPTYTGKVVWDQKQHIKKGSRGNSKHITIDRPKEQWTIVQGVHPPIVTEETYEKAQEIMGGRSVPAKRDGTVKNPLAGLLRCGNCGRNMQRMVMKGEPYLLCMEPGCCAAAKLSFVEEQILLHLHAHLEPITVEQSCPQATDSGGAIQSLSRVRRELSAAGGQKARLHELLEMGEYDLSLFRARMASVVEKIGDLEEVERAALLQIQHVESSSRAARAREPLGLLTLYERSDAAVRNALLHKIIEYGVYYKEKKSKPRELHLQLYLRPF